MFYSESLREEDKRFTSDIIVYTRTNNDKIKTMFTENGDIVSQVDDNTGKMDKSFSEGLPDEYSNHEGIHIQKRYDGCYPGYKPCGADCGDFGSRGGGTSINKYDTSCRTHDRC